MKRTFLSTLLLLVSLPGCTGAAAPAETGGQLPRGFKGYELYSWQEAGQWHFTLVTGTNRNKTRDELVSPGETISPDGWVKIHVIGSEAIVGALARLPRGEQVFWLGLPSDGQTAFPPPETIASIEEKAAGMGLALHAPSTP